MDELDALKDTNKQFVQQAELISFVSGTVRSEAKIARMLLRVSDAQIPMGALMRTLEAMTDRINNFWATITAWRARVSTELVQSSERVRTYMRRVLGGARTAIRWINRANIRSVQSRLAEQQDRPGPTNAETSLSQIIAEHLPLLRRYSRVLLGNQSAGDNYVGAVLEAILRQRELLSSKHGPRIGLFKVLHDLVDQFAISAVPDDASSKVRALHTLPLRMREAFLLTAMEGFDVSEVANNFKR